MLPFNLLMMAFLEGNCLGWIKDGREIVWGGQKMGGKLSGMNKNGRWIFQGGKMMSLRAAWWCMQKWCEGGKLSLHGGFLFGADEVGGVAWQDLVGHHGSVRATRLVDHAVVRVQRRVTTWLKWYTGLDKDNIVIFSY